MRRVVVTGVGMVTPLGANMEWTWKNLVAGKSGIRKIPEDLPYSTDLASKVIGYIPNIHEDPESGFDQNMYVNARDAKTMDRFIVLSIAAAKQAMEDSGFLTDTEDKQLSSGVLFGAGIGGLVCIENNAKILAEKGVRRVSPFFIPASLINLAAGHISINHKLRGPNLAVVTACASGSHAIGEAARIITCGDADMMLCGGVEAALCPLGIAGFTAARALSTRFNDTPEKASRPWDKRRDGFVMSEGGGMVVLEEYEQAKKRGARIYGELIGYGISGDAYHITAPEPYGNGAIRAMVMALRKANINPEQVDYINAHGTSTPPGDIVEYRAVKNVFTNHTDIIMSSTKSATGHMLGGAGSAEAIFCLLAMRDGIVPPTLNLEDPEDEISGINLVPNNALEKKINIVLSNSFGFGGTNTSLVFKKV